MRSWGLVLFGIIVLASLSACMTAQEHVVAVQQGNANQLTVGVVQREIRVGMSGAEVAAVLGFPNVVMTDEQRREAWVYDKISTDEAHSGSYGGASILILGGKVFS